ncbi:fibrillin-1-like isoform X1 [Montipora capricornis]|uniref:fibrillin-1-like isoform X1 n=1 Tax=Montipora capricornis TaxID=246305 RepID=UPI0035F1C67B
MPFVLQLNVVNALVLLILRFSCGSLDGNCRELVFPPSFFFVNKRLLNHNITTFQVRDLDACELFCYHNANCVSINFDSETYRCDLNNATHRIHDDEFVDTVGYLYRGADSACDTVRCNNGGNCQSGFTDKGFQCLCPPGFAQARCQQDINECTSGDANCSVDAICKNSHGSYSCTCKPGYTGDGYNCTDIDECSTGEHNCSHMAVCNNTIGSYNCTCQEGYVGDGRNCSDVDECSTGKHNCSYVAVCNNTNGSYKCTCKEGYVGDGRNCSDKNECTSGDANCSIDAICKNTHGSYNCTCKPGYTGDGYNCTGPPDPVAWFPLNTSYRTKEINNRVTQGNPLNVVLAPGPDGRADGSYKFKGQGNSYIEFMNSPGGALNVKFSMTVLCWLNYKGQDGPVFNYALNNYKWGVVLRIINKNIFVHFRKRDYGVTMTLQSSTPTPTDTWTFVGASYNHSSGEAKLFVDGEEVKRKKQRHRI